MIDTHKEILYLVNKRKWKQDKAEDVVSLFQRQLEKGYENLATKADLVKLEGMLDTRIERLEGNIKALDVKITMFMWFITIGVALFELVPYIMKVVK